jgi:cytochrome c-type biogenesis protein CcmF
MIFVVLTFTVLLGTVFPLVTEAVRGTQVSVGEPYFNRMAVPVGLLMVFMMGVGPVLPWGKPSAAHVLRSFVVPVSTFTAVVVLCLAFGVRAWLALFTFGLCGFAMAVTLREMTAPARERMQRRKEPWLIALVAGITGNRRRFGGYVVHIAVIFIVAAVAASATYKTTTEASLAVGESFEVGPYTVTYERGGLRKQEHRDTVFAHMVVTRDGKQVGVMAPALNYYENQREPIGTPDVFTIGQRDLYLSLLSIERDGSRVGVRAFTIPLVVWLWYAIPVIAAGSLTALWPKRRARAASVPVAEGSAA